MENLHRLKEEVHRYLGKDVEVFVPSYFWMDHGERHVVQFLEGYIFVRMRDATSGILPETKKIVDFLQKNSGGYSRSVITEACGLSDSQWCNAVAEALSSGLVSKSGQRRGTKYERCKHGPSCGNVFQIEKSRLFSRVLSCRLGNRRVPEVIPDGDIQRLRDQGEEFICGKVTEGDRVVITNGVYKNLSGIVLHRTGTDVVVQIRLRSIEILAQVPFFITESAEE